jgi:hypothetical protein
MFEFETQEELQMFLADIPFFKNEKCFCFGKTLEEAGKIFRQLMQERSGASEVGMAVKKDK